MLRIMQKFALCLLASVLGAADCSVAQSFAGTNRKTDLAHLPLENVRIEVQSIEELFSRLSFSYDIPVGLEIARNDEALPVYRLNFKGGTLSDLLTQFVIEHNQYDWEIKDGVVSVFPKEVYRDPILGELLATEISRFSVKEKSSCWALGESLVATPEIRRILELYGLAYDAGSLSGFYIQQLGQRFAFEVSKMQLKSILEKVIRESPVARIWIIRKDSSAQTLSLRIKARLEYSPETSKEAGSARQNFH